MDPKIAFQLNPFDNGANEPVKSLLPKEWRNNDDWEKRTEDFEDEGAPDDDSE